MDEIEKLKIDKLSSKVVSVLAFSVAGLTTIDTGINLRNFNFGELDERYIVIFGSIIAGFIMYSKSKSTSNKIDEKNRVYSL